MTRCDVCKIPLQGSETAAIYGSNKRPMLLCPYCARVRAEQLVKFTGPDKPAIGRETK